MLTGAATCAILMSATSCSGGQSAPAPASASTAAPASTPAATFASDEEALAAGVAAVEKANQTTADLINDPSRDLAAVQDVAVDTYIETMTSQITDYRDNKRRVEGTIALTPVELVYQRFDGGNVEVQFYYCADDGNYRRLNADGSQYTVGQGRNTARMIATVKGDSVNELKLSEVNVWKHGVTC